jgi:hypothetical protein
VAKKSRREETEVVGFLSVGLDNEDGHQRLTRTDHFIIVGGSAETHEQMQDTAIYFNEGLEQRGKRLEEASVEEALDLLREALDR